MGNQHIKISVLQINHPQNKAVISTLNDVPLWERFGSITLSWEHQKTMVEGSTMYSDPVYRIKWHQPLTRPWLREAPCTLTLYMGSNDTNLLQDHGWEKHQVHWPCIRDQMTQTSYKTMVERSTMCSDPVYWIKWHKPLTKFNLLLWLTKQVPVVMCMLWTKCHLQQIYVHVQAVSIATLLW